MNSRQGSRDAVSDHAALLARLSAATPDRRGGIALEALSANAAPLPGLAMEAAEPGARAAPLNGRNDGSPSPRAWWNSERAGERMAQAALRGERESAVSLQDADLRGADLRGADLRGVDLRRADLRGALLGGAALCGANLEQTDLTGADLAGADLSDALLGEANLKGAMLEEAVLERASMRFAHLVDTVLEDARLGSADMWGANLRSAVLIHADLQHARLEEANLEYAQLQGALLQDAQLFRANLSFAGLQDSKLQGLDLSECELRHASLARAWLSKTTLRPEQLDGAIGEELAKDYAGARDGYLALERNFAELGNSEASSWAYRQKRRMQTLMTRERAGQQRHRGAWRTSARLYIEYASLRFVEWLCDYGESLGRVVRATALMYLAFTTAYVAFGLLRAPEGARETDIATGFSYVLAVAAYSLVAMTTAGFADIGLEPANMLVHVMSGVQGVLLMVLAGLFGFVLAAQIRR